MFQLCAVRVSGSLAALVVFNQPQMFAFTRRCLCRQFIERYWLRSF